jgi:hypothetical protein
MLSFGSVRKLVLVLMVFVFALGLMGCGADEYAEATNAALADFNAAGGALTDQLMMINSDNAIISDPDWQDATWSAVDEFEAAGQAFASLPEAPEEYQTADALLTDLAFETTSLADAARTMIETQDPSQINVVNEIMGNINSLVTQVDDAISAGNQ